jgi:mannose-6-phosphate isomerase-like protein (cupin superfamily)
MPDAVQPRATILARNEGTLLTARGAELLFKAVAADTGGAFSLMDRVLPPGGRPPPAHVHPDCVEAFFLLEGSLEFVLDGERSALSQDGFVLVPGGVAHTFVNAGSGPARVLILHSPALDGYFRDLHLLWTGESTPTPAQERELMLRHGLIPVDDGAPGSDATPASGGGRR